MAYISNNAELRILCAIFFADSSSSPATASLEVVLPSCFLIMWATGPRAMATVMAMLNSHKLMMLSSLLSSKDFLSWAPGHKKKRRRIYLREKVGKGSRGIALVKVSCMMFCHISPSAKIRPVAKSEQVLYANR